MKNFFILLLLLVNFQTFGQKGYFKYPAKFYSIIDSTQKLDCCDSCNYGITITYDIPLLEFPYQTIDLDDYEMNHCEDDYVMSYVENLVKSYYEIKPSIRNRITKSCFNLSTKYTINKDITNDGFYWIDGTLTIQLIFQTDNPNFGKPWWKKIFTKKPRR